MVDSNRGGRKGAGLTEVTRSRRFMPQLEGEVAYDVCEGQNCSEYQVQCVYDEIIPKTWSETFNLKLQQDVDCHVIEGTGQNLQTIGITENVAYQKQSMLVQLSDTENTAPEKDSITIELEKNVAYQGVCGLQQHKDLPVESDSIILYETVN